MSHMLETGEYHPGDPEENDIIPGHENRGGVVFFQFRGAVGPSQRRKGPQCRGKPRVQYVGLLPDGRAADGAGCNVLLGNGHLSAGVAVEGGDAVSPPKLTRDAPVVAILHPVDVDFGEAVGGKFHVTGAHRLQCRLRERLHLDEPLVGCHRLDRVVATVAGADVVRMRLDRKKVALRLQIGDQRLAAGVAIHALILAGIAVHGRIVVHDLDLFQSVPLADKEVVGVVRGRDLDAPRSEPDFHIVIGDNGDFPTHDRQNQRLADQMPGCLIIRVDRNGGITEHGFRAGGCHLDIAVLTFDGILDVPEEAGLLGVFDFCVRQCRGAVRTPVDDAVTAVNQSLIIEIDEHFPHGTGAAIVHGKALARPIAGGTQLFELPCNACLVGVLPRPYAAQEFLTSEVVARLSLVHAQALLHLDLRGYAGVVGAGNPQGIVALHPLGAHQNILQCLVQRVPHVELTGHIRGGDDHRKGGRGICRIRGEVSPVAPHLIDAVFKFRRGIGFWQFGRRIHAISLLYFLFFREPLIYSAAL